MPSMLGFLAVWLLFWTGDSYTHWSFQQILTVPEAGDMYGKMPFGMHGRGFITLISGYQESSPGSIYVHTTDDGVIQADGNFAWSLQARLVPKDPSTSPTQPPKSFGKTMATDVHTVIVSSPLYSLNTYEQGAIYIFNGTGRHWSQLQRIYSADATPYEHFGEAIKFEKNRMVISAQGYKSNTGAIYIYDRNPTTLLWSRQSKLIASDTAEGSLFGRSISLSGDTAIAAALNDDYGIKRSGSAYFFNKTAGLWSQQQKLVSIDAEFSYLPLMIPDKWSDSRPFMFAHSVTHNSDAILVGIKSLTNFTVRNRESIYVFRHGSGTWASSWSLQQKLFMHNDSGSDEQHLDPQAYEHYRTAEVSLQDDTLLASIYGPDVSSCYLFSNVNGGWSQQQRLVSPIIDNGYPSLNFSLPSMAKGRLLFGGEKNAILLTQFQEKSCLRLYLSDQFLDGWDIAVLTVRAPDTTQDTFYPHCDQVNPFYVRYCPASADDEGYYIVKVFAATKSRFFWEISWQVMLESTGQWFKGDFASKMIFHFNSTTNQFSFSRGENLIDMFADCYRCTTIDTNNWAYLKTAGAASFIKLIVTGAPYFISDPDGYLLFSSGRVCNSVAEYSCYVSIPEGIYTLRLGHGTFNGEVGTQALVPGVLATWSTCGLSGTIHDQLIFYVANSICTPILLYNYSSRCTYNSTIFTKKYGTFKNPLKNVYGLENSRINADGTLTPPLNDLLSNFKHHKAQVASDVDSVANFDFSRRLTSDKDRLKAKYPHLKHKKGGASNNKDDSADMPYLFV